VKVSDIVKRNEKLWESFGGSYGYITKSEMQEVGIIIAFDSHYKNMYLDSFDQTEKQQEQYVLVLWSRKGLSYEDIDDITVVTCKVAKSSV